MTPILKSYREITLNETAVRRFWAKVQKSDGCWNWTGAKDQHGYGDFRMGGRAMGSTRAHRVSWFLTFGLSPKAHVLHHCDNPSCVRPDHLFLGDDLANMRDMSAKGRHHNQQKTHCPSGHPYSDENTYVDYCGRRRCRICTRAIANKSRRDGRRMRRANAALH
jgi:hypothetical protein